MDQASITEKMETRFGDAIIAKTDSCGQHAITVRAADLLSVATHLRDDAELSMNMLMDIAGVDYLEFPLDENGEGRGWRYEVVYQFMSLAKNHRYRVKVAVGEDDLHVPTLATNWGVANWMEREVFDQFGLIFDGHKNLVRILNHHEFEGHPLRKDYPINRRQKLSKPIEHIIPEDPEWA